MYFLKTVTTMHEHCNSYCNTIYLNVFEMSNFLANTMKQICFKQTLEIKKKMESLSYLLHDFE